MVNFAEPERRQHALSERILDVDHFQSDGGKWNKYAIHDQRSTSFSAVVKPLPTLRVKQPLPNHSGADRCPCLRRK